MKRIIIDADSFSKVNTISLKECYDALLILNRLLRRNMSMKDKFEIESYIGSIQDRILALDTNKNSPKKLEPQYLSLA